MCTNMFLKLNAYAIVYTSNLHSTCILLQTALQAHSYIQTANSVTTYKPSLLLQTALQARSKLWPPKVHWKLWPQLSCSRQSVKTLQTMRCAAQCASDSIFGSMFINSISNKSLWARIFGAVNICTRGNGSKMKLTLLPVARVVLLTESATR